MLKLGPSINGLVTDGNTKLCCRGFVLTLFQSTKTYKIGFELTRDYTKLFPDRTVEIVQVTVDTHEVLLSFLLIYDDFRLKVPKLAKKDTLVMLSKTDKHLINITRQPYRWFIES